MKLIGLDRKQALAGKFSTTIPIRTPISGYVTQVNVNLGKFVNSTDAMFEIVNTEHLHAELMVFEKDVIRIRKGQKIRFTLPNESNQQRQATVYLIGKEIDQNRAVRVHGHLDQEDTNLLPGMFINAVIEVSANTVSAVPEQAVVKSEGKQYIFVQRQGHEEQPNDKPRKEKATEEVQAGETTFEMIEVKTGVSDLGYVHITPLQEIPANGKIVIQGAFFLLSHKNNAEGGGEEHGH
ncbi:MAG: efflux RND transporter periplasmic adaptor subunit [Bacteroidota bacterium]